VDKPHRLSANLCAAADAVGVLEAHCGESAQAAARRFNQASLAARTGVACTPTPRWEEGLQRLGGKAFRSYAPHLGVNAWTIANAISPTQRPSCSAEKWGLASAASAAWTSLFVPNGGRFSR